LKLAPANLTFKFGIILILVQAVILTCVGYFYSEKFAAQIDKRIENQTHIPGELINSGLLNINAMTDRKRMEKLVGSHLQDGMVIGANKIIFSSIKQPDIGKTIDDLHRLDQFSLTQLNRTTIRNKKELITITPIFASDQKTPRFFVYVSASTAETNSEKLHLILLFFWGSLATLVLTSAVIVLFFKYNIFNRLQRTRSALLKVEDGDLSTRITDNTSDDEIGLLNRSVNTMVTALEKNVYSLKTEILERKKTEEMLQRYKHIISSTDDMMSFVDKNYVYQAVNEAYLKAHKRKREDIIGFSVEQLMGKDSFQELVKQNLDFALAGNTVKFQSWFKYVGIGKKFMDFTYHPFKNDHNQVAGIIVCLHDITALKEAEEALRQNELKYKDLVENINDVIFSTDKDGILTYISPVVESWSDYTQDELIGKSIKDFIQPADHQFLNKQLLASFLGQLESSEYRSQTKSGEIIWLSVSSRPVYKNGEIVGLGGILSNITEKKHLESQLIQAQKMEAIGTLAGGIAHDFNNLLMAIQGRISLMLLERNQQPEEEHLKAIEEYIESAAGLTGQLLGFARGGKYETKPININQLVRTSSAMFSRAKKEIEIHIETERLPLVVEVDHQQIEQVLLNIYVNASQAMPDGGKLFLATKAAKLDQKRTEPHGLSPGQYVRISIRDTGIGMPDAIKKRIFDPFFTTKDKGRGTGLGLASAYGIIKNHSGFISVHSEPGHGAVFNIFLPLSPKESTLPAPKNDEIINSSGTILLIDDEDIVLDVGKALLEKLGYQVIVAKGGQMAINKLQQHSGSIDLAILDLIMPGLDGKQTYEQLHELMPKLPVILSSGYSINGQATEILQKGGNGFIQKPYNISQLSQKINDVLKS
jgi:two-component system, cell cycle sensor histidine kinase and response regulator CckA